MGWKVQRVSSVPFAFLRGLQQIVAVIRAGRQSTTVVIDVFSTRSFIVSEVVAWLARASGLPVVLVLHGGKLVERAQRDKRRMEQLLRSATAVVTPSKYLQEHLRAMVGVSATYLPNGLSIQAYPFKERGPVQPKFIWLRALNQGYDPMTALKALAIIVARESRATLVFGGPDRG
ncbi:MAG: glycosyltransferase, partial [Candidatus Micrarchaeota archaeon]